MQTWARLAVVAGLGFALGCQTKKPADQAEEKPSKLQGIFNKKPQEIKPADPKDERKEGKVVVDENLISGRSRPASQPWSISTRRSSSNRSKHSVRSMVAIPRITTSSWKRSSRYNVKLQSLPDNLEYQYDAEQHELIVVEKKAK